MASGEVKISGLAAATALTGAEYLELEQSGVSVKMALVGTDATALIVLDTAANLASSNPTLGAGMLGVESDTGYTKLGDGSTAWNSLKYSSPRGPASFTPVVGGCGTITSAYGQWWQIGARMIAEGVFTTGTVTASTLTIAIPNSEALATYPDAGYRVVGNLFPGVNGADLVGFLRARNAESYLTVGTQDGSHNALGSAYAANSYVASSTLISFRFDIPISGW